MTKNDRRTALFFFSPAAAFMILFFELICIRWIPSYVRYLSYFSNFILLGAFLGIGLGTLTAKWKFNLLPMFSGLMLLLVMAVQTFQIELRINTSDVLYFQSSSDEGRVESFFLLPMVFLLVAAMFATLGQELGRMFLKLADLWKLAQAPLNGRLRLRQVDAAEALAAWDGQRRYLSQVAQGLASAGWIAPAQNSAKGVATHAD